MKLYIKELYKPQKIVYNEKAEKVELGQKLRRRQFPQVVLRGFPPSNTINVH